VTKYYALKQTTPYLILCKSNALLIRRRKAGSAEMLLRHVPDWLKNLRMRPTHHHERLEGALDVAALLQVLVEFCRASVQVYNALEQLV
jgi:hypothetical protein